MYLISGNVHRPSALPTFATRTSLVYRSPTVSGQSMTIRRYAVDSTWRLCDTRISGEAQTSTEQTFLFGPHGLGCACVPHGSHAVQLKPALQWTRSCGNKFKWNPQLSLSQLINETSYLFCRLTWKFPCSGRMFCINRFITHNGESFDFTHSMGHNNLLLLSRERPRNRNSHSPGPRHFPWPISTITRFKERKSTGFGTNSNGQFQSLSLIHSFRSCFSVHLPESCCCLVLLAATPSSRPLRFISAGVLSVIPKVKPANPTQTE